MRITLLGLRLLRVLDDAGEVSGEAQLRRRWRLRGDGAHQLVELAFHLARIGAGLLDQAARQAGLVLEQHQREVRGLDLGMRMRLGELLRRDQGLTRLLGERMGIKHGELLAWSERRGAPPDLGW